ncbi:MAG: MBL fold metallo-hydrolase [Nitrososphaerota archaeon]|nr:MBL fold metallo-hydrolase [Candidatus Bathyarchaeota archaeon]MDW8022652.1 MBL fold metallo-hydrolase [Nitrososphaerota archaeon]
MFFRQIKHHGDNFSYIIADESAKEAAVVDPSFNADVITKILKEQNLKLKFIINTHGHGDHTAGNRELQKIFNAKIVAHKLAKIKKNISVEDGDVLKLGKTTIKVIHTPGHTQDSICLLVEGKLLTGDTLFVGDCGRTDLSGGSPKDMYDSLFNKILKLDDDIEVYPGHDYGAHPYSTIGRERKTNYTLEKRTMEEFIEFMRQP